MSMIGRIRVSRWGPRRIIAGTTQAPVRRAMRAGTAETCAGAPRKSTVTAWPGGGPQVPRAEMHGDHEPPPARLRRLVQVRPLGEDQPATHLPPGHEREVDEVDDELAEVAEGAAGDGIHRP